MAGIALNARETARGGGALAAVEGAIASIRTAMERRKAMLAG